MQVNALKERGGCGGIRDGSILGIREKLDWNSLTNNGWQVSKVDIQR
jgi:hypothetical protein